VTEAPTIHQARFAALTPAQLYGLLRLRVDVFVVEQHCAYAELDGRDLEGRTRHFWLGGDGDPEPVLGCLRLLEEPDGRFRIGRVCTVPAARGRGLGRRLVEAALAEVGDVECLLDAQEHLAGFYRAFGFGVIGPAYDWDGVPHVPMRRGGR